MLSQNVQIDTSEIWSDLQYHRVSNYLTGQKIYTHGSLRLNWSNTPWIALYTAVEYHIDGGPLWVFHSEGLTAHLYEALNTPVSKVMQKFEDCFRNYLKDGDNSEFTLEFHCPPDTEQDELKKWISLMDCTAADL